MNRFVLWISLAMVMLAALPVTGRALDVQAINQQIARLQGELREIESKIKDAESIIEEARKTMNYAIAVRDQATQAKATWDRGEVMNPSLDPETPTEWPLESYADDILRKRPYVSAASGATITNYLDLVSYAAFMRNASEKARQELQDSQPRHREKIAELERLQWHLVATGVGQDPLLGSWNLVLGTRGTVVTVRKAPDGRQYVAVIDISTLEHFPRGAMLFSVIIDLEHPYTYVGMQYGYTGGRRDAREDEPLHLVVRGDTMSYDNRQQQLMWQRLGGRP